MNLAEEYTKLVGLDHRRRLAQFFTPPEIARFMVGWVLGGGEKAIHDPAFGLGAFFDAAPPDCAFSGTDSDGAILDFFKEHSARKPLRLGHADYLLDFGQRPANIVCNPPYLRFQKFLNRDTVFEAFRSRLGIRLSGYTNIASAFLVKSISELAPGGRLAYVMPSEFLNCGYGKQVKALLVRNRHLDSLIEIECEREAFDEVTTSVCIVLYDSARDFDTVSFRRVVSLDELGDVMEHPPVCAAPLSRLDPGDKWGTFFTDAGSQVRPAARHLCRLSEYGRFSRGIATGANDFFVLDRADAEGRGLSEKSCLPCITKSQQIGGVVFTDNDFKTLADSGARVYLFAPGDTPDEASLRYIRRGEEAGCDKGFITSHRNPWYKTEARAVSPILLNVFSRSGYKVVRNYSSALTLTNFHCFYPYALRGQYVDWLFLYLLSGVGRQIVSLCRRKYGNALEKFEPNDLNKALVPNRGFFDSLGADTLENLMSAVKRGDDVGTRLDSLFVPLLEKEIAESSGDFWYSMPDTGQLLFAMEKKRRGYSAKGAGKMVGGKM